MSYHFKNLVFEGGGVKGIAYVGALQALEKRNILPQIKRVGGTSAGAINAALLALGYSNKEQLKILKGLDFNNFLDDSWGLVRDSKRLVKDFGWYKGDFFADWISQLVEAKTGIPFATFSDLRFLKMRDLFVCGTNLSTGFGEVFSYETTPQMSVAEAIRISMSIPLFFKAMRSKTGDVFVDGGVLNNYPIKLFDKQGFVSKAERTKHALVTDYYEKENKKLKRGKSAVDRFIYNKETLGFRLDSKEEINIFRDKKPPKSKKIDDFFDYLQSLVTTLLNVQEYTHLHGDDWQRTIYIDTMGVGTTDFDISDKLKDKLFTSGRDFTESYFKWYDIENPANKPSDQKVINIQSKKTAA